MGALLADGALTVGWRAHWVPCILNGWGVLVNTHTHTHTKQNQADVAADLGLASSDTPALDPELFMPVVDKIRQDEGDAVLASTIPLMLQLRSSTAGGETASASGSADGTTPVSKLDAAGDGEVAVAGVFRRRTNSLSSTTTPADDPLGHHVRAVIATGLSKSKQAAPFLLLAAKTLLCMVPQRSADVTVPVGTAITPLDKARVVSPADLVVAAPMYRNRMARELLVVGGSRVDGPPPPCITLGRKRKARGVYVMDYAGKVSRCPAMTFDFLLRCRGFGDGVSCLMRRSVKTGSMSDQVSKASGVRAGHRLVCGST